MTTTGVRGLLRRALGLFRPSRPATPVHRGQPDFHGSAHIEYSPHLDGAADPGEIVWTWVPYEDDPTQGKDRPVLVVGRDGPSVLALMLTSKDHTRDAAREAQRGRRWMDIGTGPWDARRRPSEVRLDRVLRLDPDAIRREGCIVDRPLFDAVVQAMPVIPPTEGRAPRQSW
ncbi:type II toxin-antitoxin system PemK/MazF family toxin [Cellulomonas rhizosphaerae]|uniref:Type II toxin-antitoxin system PemK/MazF family toxin n=1 Tax=Cellulomonas rhizosphaerae TaxID=2293719 RepID=A0A413RQ71_9CELL|nr:type II toxin-antitoxin system PemK/MazF family toxin [Cellulomonas rhizosphaerae]RHA44070.1 type II toxin-antitoxin system PemK/MazF family toxin [Cellulomonas rhizosphaerae]